MAKVVLIVDDSRVARMILAKQIRGIGGDWEIIEAGDGAEAIETDIKQSPDVVIMDFNMPGMDGMEAAASIKETHPGARITMLTANIQKAVAERAESLGIGFLEKPVNVEKLAAFLAG